MRIGVVVEPLPGVPWPSLRDQVETAEGSGLDLCWVREVGPFGEPMAVTVLAASLASIGTLRVFAQLGIGDHPVELAEELAVADLCLGGRLEAVLDPALDPDALEETLSVLLAALAPRPFVHRGERWQVPRRQDEGEADLGPVRVTPAPAQLELPVRVLGLEHVVVAARHGVPPVARSGEVRLAPATWADLERSHGAARHRWRRAALEPLGLDADGSFDADALVAVLHAARRSWGLDTWVCELPAAATLSARCAAMVRLGRAVRPRVQLDSLPQGLEEHWKRSGEQVWSAPARRSDAGVRRG